MRAGEQRAFLLRPTLLTLSVSVSVSVSVCATFATFADTMRHVATPFNSLRFLAILTLSAIRFSSRVHRFAYSRLFTTNQPQSRWSSRRAILRPSISADLLFGSGFSRTSSARSSSSGGTLIRRASAGRVISSVPSSSDRIISDMKTYAASRSSIIDESNICSNILPNIPPPLSHAVSDNIALSFHASCNLSSGTK